MLLLGLSACSSVSGHWRCPKRLKLFERHVRRRGRTRERSRQAPQRQRLVGMLVWPFGVPGWRPPAGSPVSTRHPSESYAAAPPPTAAIPNNAGPWTHRAACRARFVRGRSVVGAPPTRATEPTLRRRALLRKLQPDLTRRPGEPTAASLLMAISFIGTVAFYLHSTM